MTVAKGCNFCATIRSNYYLYFCLNSLDGASIYRFVKREYIVKREKKKREAREKKRRCPRRPVARPRACRRRWFIFFRFSQESLLWASIYRFFRHADGSGLGYCAKKGSARTVLHTAVMLLSLVPW